MSVPSVDTIEQWNALSQIEKSKLILETMSGSRLDVEGGYPDAWLFRDIDGVTHVICATLGYKGQPELILQDISEFISDNECWITDDLEEDDE